MQLPFPSAHYSQRVAFGTYVTRRLRKAKLNAMAVDAEITTQAVKTKGRLHEDANLPIQAALADRDGADIDLDGAAQTLRAGLAGRSVNAINEAPYTHIFPLGISYYTAARLDEQVPRYTELQQRITQHLPASDPLQKPALDDIAVGLSDYNIATSALSQARIQEAMAQSALDAAEEDWERLMEKIYGILVSELGRKAAEQFFPRAKSRAKSKKNTPADEG